MVDISIITNQSITIRNTTKASLNTTKKRRSIAKSMRKKSLTRNIIITTINWICNYLVMSQCYQTIQPLISI